MSLPAGIQRLLPRHFKIIDLAAAGHDAKAIATILNMHVTTVAQVLRSPLVQHELSRVRRESRESETLGLDRSAAMGKARSILEQASERAAKTCEELLNSDNDSVRLRAADKILDRVFGSEDKSKPLAINITAEHVNLLVQALQESDNARRQVPDRAPAEATQDQHVDVRTQADAG